MSLLPTIHGSSAKGATSALELVRLAWRGNLVSAAHWRAQASAAHTAGDVRLLVFAQENAVRFDAWAREDAALLKHMDDSASASVTLDPIDQAKRQEVAA